MENANAGSTFVVPTLDVPAYSVDYHLSAKRIEEVILSPEEQNKLNLGVEEDLQPDYWHVTERNHQVAPQPVIEEAGVRKAPDIAAEMDLGVEGSAAYLDRIGGSLERVRWDALIPH